MDDFASKVAELEAKVAELEAEADWLAGRCAQACRFTNNRTCAWLVKPMVSKDCTLSFCRSTKEDWRKAARKVVADNG